MKKISMSAEDGGFSPDWGALGEGYGEGGGVGPVVACDVSRHGDRDLPTVSSP